jgi:nitroimidazol reductase NimA-like FMN-containing flavoprotein (pyridoxamine 5'-phosphate oxidase superfamily)
MLAHARHQPLARRPAPAKRLDRSLLQERILNLFSSQNLWVLATCGPDGPLATPVRYYHLGFTLMFTAWASSPKMRNIGADPRVSIGIFAPLVGQASGRGAQVFGQARILAREDGEDAHYWPAYRWESANVEPSRPLDQPPGGPLIVVSAEWVVYTEHWLRRDGYAPRQFWSATGAPAKTW